MKRQLILDTIERHLRIDPKQTQRAPDSRTLIEVVARVAKDIRTIQADPSTVVAVIPIEQVAAFVAGSLEPEKIDAVCRSVMIDNGVLAELVAAVRASHTPEDSLPPVTEELTARLLATHPIEPVSAKDVAKMMREPEVAEHRQRTLMVLPLLALAILAAVFVLSRPKATQTTTSNDPPPKVAQDQTESTIAVDTSSNPKKETEADPPSETVMLKPELVSDSVEKVPTLVEPEVAPKITGDAPEMPIVAPEMTVPNVPSTNVVTPEPVLREKSVPMPKMGVATWTAITGLLGVTNETSQPEETVGEVPFRRVRTSAVTTIEPYTRLRTPSLSRAEAEFQSGGVLLLKEDTEAIFSAVGDDVSAEIELRAGAIVLKNLSDGSKIALDVESKRVGVVTFKTDSMVSIRAVAGGVEVRLSQADATAIDADAFTVIPSASVPEWVTQTPPTLEKVSLSQIGDTDNLAVALEAQINRLASSTRLTDAQSSELTKLIEMRLSVAGDFIFRLSSSGFEEVRRAAIESIALLSKSDPRYERVWKTINAEVVEPARREQVDRWMQLIRTGGRPTESELQNMLAGLASPKPNIRGFSDVMLRSYVTKPPSLNPMGDSAQMIEAAAAYRRQLADR